MCLELGNCGQKAAISGPFLGQKWGIKGRLGNFWLRQKFRDFSSKNRLCIGKLGWVEHKVLNSRTVRGFFELLQKQKFKKMGQNWPKWPILELCLILGQKWPILGQNGPKMGYIRQVWEFCFAKLPDFATKVAKYGLGAKFGLKMDQFWEILGQIWALSKAFLRARILAVWRRLFWGLFRARVR